MDTNFLKNPLTKGECKLVFAFVLFLSVNTTSATAAFDAANVGEHDVTFEGFTLSGDDAANYTLSNQPATVQNKITKKTLTIAAKNKTITFGDAPANDGVTYDGFVDGDDATQLTGSLEYEYTYTTNGNVGTYSITPKGLSSGNYNIEFKSGTLTVEPKEITVNWTNTSLTYNAQPQQPTATAGELVENFPCTVNVTVTGEHTDAGNYVATASIENQNYKLPTDGSAQQNFTINPKSTYNHMGSDNFVPIRWNCTRSNCKC